VPPVTVVVPRRRVTRRLVLQSHVYGTVKSTNAMC
jgi:hypothetical protein